jgi:hypothetical protein
MRINEFPSLRIAGKAIEYASRNGGRDRELATEPPLIVQFQPNEG